MPIAPIAAMGIQAGLTAAGAIGQQQLGIAKNEKQYHLQKRLMDQQDIHQRQMALFNQEQQMKMWEATGPQGMAEQLRKAGLNPGLIYGMGGAGGQTAQAAQAQSASTPSAGSNYGNEFAGMGLMLQQAELIRAQTEKTIAETKNITAEPGTIGEASLKNIIQDTSNKAAQEANTKIQTDLATIQKQIAEETKTDVSNQITDAARKTNEELQILVNQHAMSDEQAIQAKQRAAEQLINMQLQNEATRQNITLTTEEIKKVAADVANQTNLTNMQLKINDLPKSVQTIVQTILTILHFAK